MVIGHYFKTRRELKGLSHAELGRLIRPGFQESLLWDFEAGDDNDIDGWLVEDFKSYCSVLEVSPVQFADSATTDLAHLSLPALIKARREEKNWSAEELAERIGYYPLVIEALESGRADSEVCIDALRQVGAELDIPFRLLLEKI